MGVEPMTDYDHQQRYQEWVQNHQETECAICYGRGWVLMEDGSNRTITCPYCHGQRHQGWVSEHRVDRFKVWRKRRNWLIVATVLLLVTGFGGDPSSTAGDNLLLLHLVLWLVLLAGWIFYWINRRPKEEKPGFTPKHAPGFTDDREKTALGIFAAGVAARSLFGRKR
jgi:hypothetical protein